MKRALTNLFLTIAIAAFITSCASENKSGRTDTFTSGSIQFAADASFSPIIEEIRELFEFKYPQAKLTPIYTNESEAIDLLMKDSLWLVITTRDYKTNELEYLKAQKQFPLSIRMAYDGLAFVQNSQNTDSCISVKDIRRILTGEVTRWDQIYPNSKRGEITVVFDNKRSATVHYVEDSILGGKPITSPNVYAVDSTAQVVAAVEEDPNAIGIIGSNWLNDKRTLYILLNDTHMGLPTGFKNFIISQDKGQMIILKAGLLPAYGNLTVRSVHVTD